MSLKIVLAKKILESMLILLLYSAESDSEHFKAFYTFFIC